MPKAQTIDELLKGGSTNWNKLRKTGKVNTDHTGATFQQLFSANADLSGMGLVGSEWERCDLSKVSFRDSDLSNAYFHGGRLQDCDFRGANLEGCTFEKLKLLRCDFSGAQGLEELEMDDVDMDRVLGLDGEEAPPPPPPPAVGVTSFTREQRTANLNGAAAGMMGNEPEPPPFRPQDAAGTLLFRGVGRLAVPPAWVLDVPGLRPPLPPRVPAGSQLEGILREAVQTRLAGSRPATDPDAVKRAQVALRLGSKDAPVAAMYLREVGLDPEFRFSSEASLKATLRREIDVDDATAAVDPRVAGALLELRLPHEAEEALDEVKRRLAAAQLFTSLLEAGFLPENNWEEALESTEASMDLAAVAAGDSREKLAEAFGAFASLPEEARLRRLGYLAESAGHLEALTRLPPDVQPHWVQGPESREHHDREMSFLQALKADDIPAKVPELAQTELGVAPGSVPEESAEDLFVHLRCPVCGLEKLLVQSPG